MEQRYEHEVEECEIGGYSSFNYPYTRSKTERELLREREQDGWELAAVSYVAGSKDMRRYYFKRPIVKEEI